MSYDFKSISPKTTLPSTAVLYGADDPSTTSPAPYNLAALTYAASGNNLAVTSQNATDVPLLVKGAGSQSGHLTDWKSSSNSSLMYVDSIGVLYPNQGLTVGTAVDILGSTGTGIAFGSAYGLGWSSTSAASGSRDISLLRDAAGILAQVNGTNAQALRVYNSSTSSNANYKRGVFDTTQATDTLVIGTETLGAGVGTFGKIKFVSEGTNVLDYNITNSGRWTIAGTVMFPNNMQVQNGILVTNAIDLAYNVTGIGLASSKTLQWSSTSSPSGGPDSGISRISAGVLGVGTGAQGSIAGGLQAASLALGGATLGGNALAVTGTSLFSGASTIGNGSATGEILKLAGGSSQSYIALYNGVTRKGYLSAGGTAGTTLSSDTDVAMQSVNGNNYLLLDGSNKQLSLVLNSVGAIFAIDAANILAQVNGTNANTFRVYNTSSSSNANYERGVFGWTDTSNVLTIGTQNAGTGVARNIQFVIGGANFADFGITNTYGLTLTQTASGHYPSVTLSNSNYANGAYTVLLNSNNLLFQNNAGNAILKLTQTGSMVCNYAALATNATDGFLYIPTCAGTPSGTPTTQTGTVALVWDTTAHKFWVYDGAWKGGTAPGVWS